MRNRRTMVGALCIVMAMVLGAFAGIVYARPGGVGVSPDVGTRGEDRRLASAFDEMQRALSTEEAEQMANSEVGTASILESAPIEMTTSDGVTARPITLEESRWVAEHSTHVIEDDDGTITVSQSDSVGTRGHFPPGTVDFGGPYGGADVFEGVDLTFSVQAFDPSVIFFRYDLNGDGTFDFPSQTGCPPTGCWTTLTTFSQRFNDNFYGDIEVQGWDGISTTIQINTGDNLGQPSSYQWFLGMFGSTYRTMGYQFRAKANMDVTALGHYHYLYTLYSMQIHQVSGAVLLGTCTPTHVTLSWNWCTLATPVSLTLGTEYRISIRVNNYMTGLNHPADTDKVQFQGTYYCFSTTNPLCMPSTFWSNSFIPELDFRWRETLIIPDVAVDSALLDINNVAPSVSDVVTSPFPGLEGTPTEFSASFSDPGTDDTWESRWTFHDGTQSPWVPVTKYSGGARVLVLHSWTGDSPGIVSNVRTQCGNFCITVDEFDFGPLGLNRIPTLDELRPYNVLLVGTNWGPIPGSAAVGDRLAEYMDATGGGIVMMFAGFDTSTTWGIGGRWQSEGYAPIQRVGFIFSTSSLGTIYVPGHPIFDGVGSMGSFYRHNQLSVASGATRIADFADGRVLAAEKVSPAGNGAIAVALPWFSLSSSGDYWTVMSNAIKYASRQAPPVLKSMPIALDPYTKIYKDDEPTTTTPVDTFPVRVEVRDDDHGKLKVFSQTPLSFDDFNVVSQCSGQYYLTNVWPPGWSSSPNPYGWVCGASGLTPGRGPFIYYYYNDPLYGTGSGNSFLNTPSYDFSSYVGVKIEFYENWQANYPSGNQRGTIEASVDGGATWPFTLHELRHNDPATFIGNVVAESTDIGGYSDVRFRFHYASDDDWWWAVDNIRFTGVVGEVQDGLGVTDGLASVANVPPTASGGFPSALRTESQGLEFRGFELSDPAILEPTEWFAYAWDFDDGSAVNWQYVGSLAPPQLDVLIVHTICLGLIASTCADLNVLTSTLNSLDDVGTVATWNFINYPALPTAPSLSLMLQYDVVIVATNWAYFSYAPFDLARRQVGDRVAQYIDAGRGGALTFMAVYDLSGGNDLFSINGRYIDEDYGPFERENYLFPGATGINILDPSHDLFVKVGPNVNSMFIHPGNMPLTVGGQNAAAGRNGQLLARWMDGNPAVGVKELNNGMRTAHFGAFGRPDGADTPMLLRNAVGWVSGGIPSPKIPTFTHTWGDNGIYTVDFMAIDDDMGFVWDAGSNSPMEALPGASLSHRFVEVAVENVEPRITGGIEAFIAAEVCVRVTGQEGNTVSLDLFTDGAWTTSVSTTRMNGDPNPPTEKCGLLRIDVTAPHTFSADLTYANPEGGSNPTWLIISPWREPITPGHGTVTYKYDLETAGTTSLALPTLKQDLFAKGDGAKIDFAAEAYDPGTDDLAFAWVFGNTGLDPYLGDCVDCTYAIHVHHNSGIARTDGTLADPQHLGFTESFFDVFTNSVRSPTGTMDFRVRDTAVHAFTADQLVYFVVLIVLDDDNTRGYPSTQGFASDGVDMEFVYVNLA